jgi:hypothetical protein
LTAVPLPQIDVTLARFESAIDVMTSNMLDLDANPTSELLETATLGGVTATRIAVARQTLERLWEQFGRFKELVDKARALRGNGNHIPNPRIDELDRLLHGPSVSLPPIEVPLANRGLLTPAETPVSTTPDQLLADMVAAFDKAKGEVLAVDHAWHVLVPRLDAAQLELTRLRALATDLGQPGGATLERCRVTVSALASKITADPLSVDPATVDSAEDSLATEGRHMAKLAVQRDHLAGDLRQARTQLDTLTSAIDAGAATLAETRAKIANPQGLLQPLGTACLEEPGNGLIPWLARLDTLAATGDWRAARTGLDHWTPLASATLAAAQKVATANATPLQQRDELRGRLDAFRAKAARLGLGEDAALAEVAAQAHDHLYAAPTDLADAEGLVARYGAALRTKADAQ